MELFQALYTIISFGLSLLESVTSAVVALFSSMADIVVFVTYLPDYVPSFVVPFLGAGIFGTIILMILARRA